MHSRTSTTYRMYESCAAQSRWLAWNHFPLFFSDTEERAPIVRLDYVTLSRERWPLPKGKVARWPLPHSERAAPPGMVAVKIGPYHWRDFTEVTVRTRSPSDSNSETFPYHRIVLLP